MANISNRDIGLLAATGIVVPEAMNDDFVKVCAPIADYSPVMSFTVIKKVGPAQPRLDHAWGSDHAYFAMIGVPVIAFRETDPLCYNFNYREIWHTERDVYYRVIPVYVEHSAVVAYGLANLNHLLFRGSSFDCRETFTIGVNNTP